MERRRISGLRVFYWAPLNIQIPGYYTIYTRSASNKFKPDHPERAAIFNEVNTERLVNHPCGSTNEASVDPTCHATLFTWSITGYGWTAWGTIFKI